jgi:hypothetical protein
MHQETTVADTADIADIADTAPPQAVPPAFALFQMITGKFVSRAVYAAARLRLADLLRDTPGSLRAMALWICDPRHGRERTAEEFRELFAAAGLRLTRVVPTAGGAFVLEASI